MSHSASPRQRKHCSQNSGPSLWHLYEATTLRCPCCCCTNQRGMLTLTDLAQHVACIYAQIHDWCFVILGSVPRAVAVSRSSSRLQRLSARPANIDGLNSNIACIYWLVVTHNVLLDDTVSLQPSVSMACGKCDLRMLSVRET